VLVLSAIKVLAYVHTYNDAEVIDATLRALCEQTYPIPEILLVDNASSDGTLGRAFPSKVTIIRHEQNLGTSGSVATGMKYALAHGYDWIYILDADSAPQKDAIESLLRCHQNLSPELQASTWWLSSLLKEENSGHVHHACVFTPRGIEMLTPPQQPPHYRCDTNMWSGSLYRLDAVKDVGLPDINYVLDWGDVIYGYEGMVRGYTGFVDQSSVVMHHLHPVDTVHFRRIGLRFVKLFYSPPLRFYYLWRNSTYFWLYKYNRENSTKLIGMHFVLYMKWLVKAALFIKKPVPILVACFRGMWDGLFARLENRY
jgi:GT2 family glycosyltransferase